MKLNVKAFALSCGILWGLAMFALTWWLILFQESVGEATLIGQVYRGFTVSPAGSLVGLGWGFLDALVGGALFALLYNKLVTCCGKPDSRNA